MISKELKSQLSILKETNPEYIQTLKDAVTASYKEATNGEPPYPVIEINRKGLANFLNDDQGYKSGKFLVSFEVPGPLPGTTEGFCEEMNVVYRIIHTSATPNNK